MSTGRLTVSPLLFNDFRGTVQVTVLREAELSAGIISTFLLSATSNVLGTTASYGHKGVLSALVLSTETRCLRILFSPPGTKKKGGHKKSRVATAGRRLLHDHILCNRAYHKLAFDAERVACALYFDHELRIAALVDAESLAAAKTRGSVAGLMAVLGGEQKVHKQLAVNVFDKRLRDIQDQEFAVLRAWATSMAGGSMSSATQIPTIPPIHTDHLDDIVLTALAKCVRDADQLTALKPTKVKNDVNTQFSTKNGQLNVTLQRYTTRIRRNDRQHIVVESSIKGRKPIRSKGTVGGVIGKNAFLNLAMSTKDAALATIKQVYTFGPENPTNAELARTMAILSTLQQSKTFLTHPLARRIFLGEGPLTAVLLMARRGKAYRIITPYDGQRSYIENLLKSEGIPWEDRCFNVDSFQGNEADHVIISVVRTEKIGFLNNRRRSNVMLSRCKRSMTICTNSAFVNGKALTTLLGDMCAEWGSGAWLSTRDILAGRL
ncbi:AAA domain-containing protein [Irpex lacteus]|nr:AAA domain-containing protein [Irpex lacteus]